MGSLAGRLNIPAVRSFVYAQLGRPYTRISCSSGICRRDYSSSSDEHQAIPLTGYWADILNERNILDREPPKTVQPATRSAPESPPAESTPKTDKEDRLEKARIVFGSRLAGPGERQHEIEAASNNVAGVIVPPKPAEPDNCCMSGCVNCVWDIYRDELEEWASKSAEARQTIQAQGADAQAAGISLKGKDTPSHVATSMDNDVGGSAPGPEPVLADDGEEGDIFDNIPVGIREFMRTEKMLKDLKQKNSSAKNVNA